MKLTKALQLIASMKRCLLSLAWLLIVGCTHVQKPPIKATALPSNSEAQRIPLHVGLVLDPAWTNYTFSFEKMGDTFKYPLGSSLVEYARSVTAHSFLKVTEFPSLESAANKSDVILHPSVAKMDHAAGMLAWQDRTLILLIEWTMRNSGNQNTLWLTTIDGRAAHAAGNLFTGKGNEQKLFQQLFDNISTNTTRAFGEAPEIRSQVESKGKP